LTTAKRLALAALACTVLPACTDWAGYDLDVASGKVPQLANMRRSVVPDPYEMPRLPAEHSIPSGNPMGDVPERFTGAQLDSVAPTLANPYAGGAPAAVLARGAAMFNNNCMVCHGPQGAGNGPVVQPARDSAGKSFGRFPGAPAINGAQTAGRSDGYIYAVIAAGRGLMPPYGERVPHLDRWAVVEYVRTLQAASGAAPQRAGNAPPAAAVPPAAPGAPAPQGPPATVPPQTVTTTAPAAAPAPAPAPPAPR
jgi:mono/diheme cytochrome c family protein